MRPLIDRVREENKWNGWERGRSTKGEGRENNGETVGRGFPGAESILERTVREVREGRESDASLLNDGPQPLAAAIENHRS